MSVRLCAARSLVLALSLTLGACAATQRENPRESLPESLRDFHSQLVWGRYAEAAGYLPEADRSYFIGSYDDLDDELEFVEYELGSVELDALNHQATVMVTLSWYRVPYYVVEETRIRETWSLSPENEYWWLVRRDDPDAPLPPEPSARADDRP